jgi:hypothetical protein
MRNTFAKVFRIHFLPPSITMNYWRNVWIFELLSWLTTALLTLLLMLPILLNYQWAKYPFTPTILLFSIIFFTATRYIFLLRFTPIARTVIPKIIGVALAIPTILYLSHNMSLFQDYLDTYGIMALAPNEWLNSPLNFSQTETLVRYASKLTLFLGTSSIVATAILPLRLIYSLWMFHNKGKI